MSALRHLARTKASPQKCPPDLLARLEAIAAEVPGGRVKTIVWDEAGGYPRHSWGVTQWTVRPYLPGYGCDGTTDSNIHLIAMTLCAKLGLDYEAMYREAYAGENLDWVDGWVGRATADMELVSETVIPGAVTEDVLIVMLSDLYQINNRSLCCVLEERLEAAGFDVRDFCLREDGARKRVREALVAEMSQARSGPTVG